jgi:purine-cytosine permease-like protein
MSYSRLSDRSQASSLRIWHVVAGGAAIAVLLQLRGLYSVSGPPQPPWFPYADKVAHTIGFALPVMLILLAVALHRALGAQWPSPRITALVVGVFAAHAVVSELIQHAWYRYRTGDPLDVIADWIGIAAGVVLARLIVRRRSHSGYRGPAAS